MTSRSWYLGSALWCCANVALAGIDLRPLPDGSWSAEHAAHLLSRAGFGGSADEIRALAALSPGRAVARVVNGPRSNPRPAFEHSGIFEPGLDPFPPSRPATTELARRQGHALGVQVKPAGNRPLQPVVDRFFYWLRASRLETDRVAYWWAERMLRTRHPLQEKMALFWHGHFATNEDKVRDYRKMLKQVQLFQAAGLGDFRNLMVGVAQDPAMLVFLDAGVNTRASPNENFAREIMELFTMGVGHYSETDVQEAARAFTGWNVKGLQFAVIEEDHDSGIKHLLGRQGAYDGVEVIDLILEQPATAEFLAAKLYRYFVNEDLDPADVPALGALMSEVDFHIGDFLTRLFRSRGFYAEPNVGTRIRSPVEMMVGTYRALGLQEVPGVPDFNVTSGALGQRLLHPPTVAGWSQGRSWITPSLLFERANFVLDVLFPHVGFIPPDRYPGYTAEIVNVQNRLRQGLSISAATRPTGVEGGAETMAASNLLADRDEDFNTRLGSMRGWQMALERVEPIPRRTARVDLAGHARTLGFTRPEQVVDDFARRFFRVPMDPAVQARFADYLTHELGTDDLTGTWSYAEESLRKVLYQMLTLPAYQLD